MTDAIPPSGSVDQANASTMEPKHSLKTRVLLRLGQVAVWCLMLSPLYLIGRYAIIPEVQNQINARTIKPVHANRQEAEEACFSALDKYLAEETSGIFKSSQFTQRTVLGTYCKPSQTKTEGIWRLFGYIEVLEQSSKNDPTPDFSSVDQTLVHFGEPYPVN